MATPRLGLSTRSSVFPSLPLSPFHCQCHRVQRATTFPVLPPHSARHREAVRPSPLGLARQLGRKMATPAANTARQLRHAVRHTEGTPAPTASRRTGTGSATRRRTTRPPAGSPDRSAARCQTARRRRHCCGSGTPTSARSAPATRRRPRRPPRPRGCRRCRGGTSSARSVRRRRRRRPPHRHGPVTASRVDP